MTDIPQIRVAQLKACARCLRKAAAEHRATLDPDMEALLVEIDQASSMAWLPAAHVAAMANAADGVWPRHGAREFGAHSLLAAADLPIMAPIIRGTMRLFGGQPGGVLKQAAKVRSLNFKNCGTTSTEDMGEHSARVRIRGLPSRLRSSPPFMDNLIGSFEGVLRFLRRDGSARYIEHLATDVVLEVTWK